MKLNNKGHVLFTGGVWKEDTWMNLKPPNAEDGASHPDYFWAQTFNDDGLIVGSTHWFTTVFDDDGVTGLIGATRPVIYWSSYDAVPKVVEEGGKHAIFAEPYSNWDVQNGVALNKHGKLAAWVLNGPSVHIEDRASLAVPGQPGGVWDVAAGSAPQFVEGEIYGINDDGKTWSTDISDSVTTIAGLGTVDLGPCALYKHAGDRHALAEYATGKLYLEKKEGGWAQSESFPEAHFVSEVGTAVFRKSEFNGSETLFKDKLWVNGNYQNIADLNALKEKGYDSVYTVDVSSKGLILVKAKKAGEESEDYGILLPVDLAVDANRNGDVEFGIDQTSQATPYRFWINNDNDEKEDKEEDGYSGNGNSDDPDHADNKILTQRDLEDLARIQLMVGGLHEQLKSGDIQVTMKFKDGTVEGDPAVNLWLHLDEDGDRDYLLDEQIAARHLTLANPGRVTKNSGYTFLPSFWSGEGLSNYPGITSAKPHRYLLFEGAAKGKGELVLEFKKGNEVLGEDTSCWINLLDVREMYERIKITPDDPDDFTPNPNHQPDWDHPANPENYIHPRDFHLREDDPPHILPPVAEIGYVADPFGKPFVPDPNEEEEYIVFVHGWNMTYRGAQKYGETMFKRLWRVGYKGRYSFVRWATYSEDTHPNFIANKFTYNDSDYRAWLSGKGVAQYVNSLPTKYGRHVVAHSMGNVVVSSALREGMLVGNYALLNAAIPAMCFDTDDNLHTFLGNAPSIRTADDDDGPITSALGFEGIVDPPYGPRLINFYLPDDSALFAWRPNNIALKPLWGATFTYGYAGGAVDGERLQLLHHDLFGSETHPTRFIRSFYESVAYCTFSKTKTAGADGRTAGSISDRLNMDEEYGFGSTHSAEWQWRTQKTNKFYRDLMGKFDLEPNF